MNAKRTKQILGVIDVTTTIGSLEPLVRNRTLSSLPFAGRYRLIDFMLSNMMHNSIDTVGVFTYFDNRSLGDHMGSGKPWDLDRKRGGMFFHSALRDTNNKGKSVFQKNIDFFQQSNHKYVVVTNGHVLGRLNFSKILKQHIETKADITELTYKGRELNICILKRELLVDMLLNQPMNTSTALIDFINMHSTNFAKKAYEVDEHVMVIDSLENYYSHSLELIDPTVWHQMFQKDYPIYTKIKDEPPTKYFEESNVSNSIVANGAKIHGEVENSIISRGVTIGKNTVVRNSIIMQKTVIGDNCLIDGVIVDKAVTIVDGTSIASTKESPHVVSKGATIQGELIFR